MTSLRPFRLDQIDEAYKVFENKEDGVIKIAVVGYM